MSDVYNTCQASSNWLTALDGRTSERLFCFVGQLTWLMDKFTLAFHCVALTYHAILGFLVHTGQMIQAVNI